MSMYESVKDPGLRSLRELSLRAQMPDVPNDVKKAIDHTLDIMETKIKYFYKHTFPVTPYAQTIADKTDAMPWKELQEKGKTSQLFDHLFISSPGQAQLLQFLTRIQRAKRFLEIGMFTGYAAMAVAEVLPVNGTVVTCELEPYIATTARRNFDESPFGKKIEIRQGPALETLDQLGSEGEQFDLVYMDADKEGYLDYFKILLDKHLLAEGGTIVVDNTFMAGDAYTKPGSLMDVFNQAVSADQRVQQIMLSISDGVSIIRRKGE